MTIGKREQIVIGVVSAIALVAILHVVIFAPSADSLKKAKKDHDDMTEQIAKCKTIPKPEVLTAYIRKTDQYLDELTSGIQALKLEQHDEFLAPPDLKDITVEVAGLKPDEIDALKKEKLEGIKKDKQAKQLDLLLGEMERLRKFLANEKVKMSFLGPDGWNVPTELPPAMQTSQLWDQLNNIAEIKGTLDRLDKHSKSYPGMKEQFENNLKVLGVDVKHAEKIRMYGEFVPMFYRLSFVSLIMNSKKSTDRPVKILNEDITRDIVLNLLEVYMPYDPIGGLTENKVYFAYEELNNLNNLLDMSLKFGLSEVSGVTFRGYGYLKQKDMSKPVDKVRSDITRLGDDELDGPDLSVSLDEDNDTDDASATGAGMGPGGLSRGPMGPMGGPMGPMGGPMGPMGGPSMGPSGYGGWHSAPGPAAPTIVNASAAVVNKRKKEEIGWSLPIKVTFRASNLNVFSYIYAVLSDKPLAELHRLVLTSLSQKDPNNTDLQATTTFLFVPKLFDTLDTVRQMIKDIKGQKNPKGAKGSVAAAGIPGASGMPSGMPGMPPATRP